MSQVASKTTSFYLTYASDISKKLTSLQKKTTVYSYQLTNNVTKT